MLDAYIIFFFPIIVFLVLASEIPTLGFTLLLMMTVKSTSKYVVG